MKLILLEYSDASENWMKLGNLCVHYSTNPVHAFRISSPRFPFNRWRRHSNFRLFARQIKKRARYINSKLVCVAKWHSHTRSRIMHISACLPHPAPFEYQTNRETQNERLLHIHMCGATPGPNSILRATNSVENKKSERERERGTAAALFTLQSRCAGIDQFQGDL